MHYGSENSTMIATFSCLAKHATNVHDEELPLTPCRLWSHWVNCAYKSTSCTAMCILFFYAVAVAHWIIIMHMMAIWFGVRQFEFNDNCTLRKDGIGHRWLRILNDASTSASHTVTPMRHRSAPNGALIRRDFCATNSLNRWTGFDL